MKAFLITYWGAIRESYWFIPSVMTLGAMVLSFVTTTLDGRLGSTWLEEVTWLYANKPDGARALLSTVAGSMITVAGVTFSITISSVVYASSQFGPRLLTNFMRDRGNQVTLGMFISTFLYCLLVLRTVRSADEVPANASEEAMAELAAAFVPHLAILCGLLFALASVGVLIYFIHHAPESMHVSNVVAGIGRDLNDKLDLLFPDLIGEAPATTFDIDDVFPDGFFETAVRIRADGNGYIEVIDGDGLLTIATEYDLLLRVEYRPGDFVMTGKPLVLVWPAERAKEAIQHKILDAFAWGPKRTQTQNVLFLVSELVEVATRALSPGINDPFTATNCMDWLGSALVQLAGRGLPNALRQDEEGNPRVVTYPVTFANFLEASLDQLRPYVSTDPATTRHMMKLLGDVGASVSHPPYRALLLEQAQRLRDAAHTIPLQPHDLHTLEKQFVVVSRLLSGQGDPEQISHRYRWLGGSA